MSAKTATPRTEGLQALGQGCNYSQSSSLPHSTPYHWHSCGNKGSEWVRGTEEEGSVRGWGSYPIS